MGDGMPLKVTMRRADHHDMSDLSRLLDDVYSNGPAKPAAAPAPPPAPAPAPAAAVEPEPEADLPWESATTMEEAFADWVPGPDADAPAAERELFELADVVDDDPLAEPPAVLGHVFAADEPTQPVDALGDLFADEASAPAPVAPAPVAPAPAPADAFSHVLAEEPLAGPAPQPAVAAVAAPPAPLAYEPPATLAEALLDAPDAPPPGLAAEVDEPWPLAGLAPIRPDVPSVDHQPGVLATTWRREHDDLLPSRGRARR